MHPSLLISLLSSLLLAQPGDLQASQAPPPGLHEAAATSLPPEIVTYLHARRAMSSDQTTEIELAAGDRFRLDPLLQRWSVNALAFSPDGKCLASASDAGVVIWDVAKRAVTRRLIGPQVRTISYSPSGSFLVGGCARHSARPWTGVLLWSTTNPAEVRRLKYAPGGTTDVRFSADGTSAVSTEGDGVIAVWDVKNGSCLRRLSRTTWNEVIAFSSDARLVARVRAPAGAEVWSLPEAKCLGKLPWWRGDRVYSHEAACFSLDQRFLATGTSEHSPRHPHPSPALILWNLATLQEMCHIPARDGIIAVAFRPDGRVIATATRSGDVSVWESGSGLLRRRLQTHGFCARCALAFSADGRYLAAGGETGIFLWDVTRPWTTKSQRGEKEIAQQWEDLASTDAGVADEAICHLVSIPVEAARFLAAKLRPARGTDPDRIRHWLTLLDSPRFRERDEATRGLEKLGAQAEPYLEGLLKHTTSAEARARAEKLLESLRAPMSPTRLRQARALEVLERAGNEQSLELLRDLARGDPNKLLTRQASEVLQTIADAMKPATAGIDGHLRQLSEAIPLANHASPPRLPSRTSSLCIMLCLSFALLALPAATRWRTRRKTCPVKASEG